jgi:hypothetical protein
MVTSVNNQGVQFIMHKASELKKVQLEISSNCQAGCMECSRWKMLEGKQIPNPNVKFGAAGNMSFDVIKETFNRQNLPVFEFIALDGNYGDSLIHPQSLEIIEYLLLNFGDKSHPNVKTSVPLHIEINSNGGYHSKEYWSELGKIFSKHKQLNGDTSSSICFGIDGVDNETHDKYRRNVVYDKVIENAEAFIKAGGKAEWKYLEFDHNVHQTDKAREIAKQLGFKKFFVKRSRWVDAALRDIIEKKQTGDDSGTKIQGAKLGKKQGTTYNRIPESKQNFIKKVEKKVKTYKNYFDDVPISCYWRGQKKIQIEYDGSVWQCCHLPPVYSKDIRPDEQRGKWELQKEAEYKFYRKNFGDDWNNLNSYSLAEILEHPYFDSLERSWNNKIGVSDDPRLSRCVEKCAITTKELTKDKREKL